MVEKKNRFTNHGLSKVLKDNNENHTIVDTKITEDISKNQIKQENKKYTIEKTFSSLSKNWEEILDRKFTTRPSSKEKGFNIGMFITNESDFQILKDIQEYAREYCRNNFTTAIIELAKIGIVKKKKQKR